MEINRENNDLELQKHFISKIREINDDDYKKSGKRKLACIRTFGCQMNAHDSEKLTGILNDMHYEETTDEELADLIVYNTCCVRENAENKVYGNLGFLKHLKKSKPHLKIILCGCMMQQGIVVETIKKQYRHVDIILGTFNLHRFPELFYTNLETKSPVIDIWEEHSEIHEVLPLKRALKHKASVNIMYGCNNFCSYCIVPYVRGRERSRAMADILDEIHFLASNGVKEITLLGQNVNSYGKELGVNFAELLREVNDIKGIERIRFMTSHPKDLSDELIKAVAECKNVCKHIHLPIQSGSTNVLKKMNRGYTKQDFLSLVERIKTAIPNVYLTTDIIVGFPTEDEDDFNETLDVVKKVRFSTAFTFIYSKRTGTPAENMPQIADEATIKRRLQQLLDTLNPIIYEINTELVGHTIVVYVDEVNAKDNTLVTGRTQGNVAVHFAGTEELIGQAVKVKITGNKTFYLTGVLEN